MQLLMKIKTNRIAKANIQMLTLISLSELLKRENFGKSKPSIFLSKRGIELAIAIQMPATNFIVVTIRSVNMFLSRSETTGNFSTSV